MSVAKSQAELERKRDQLEQAVSTLRARIGEATGGRSAALAWTLPLLAASIGLALAFGIKSRRKNRRSGD